MPNCSEVFDAVQSTATAFSQNPELEGFMSSYVGDEANALLLLAFLYAMGDDLQSKHQIHAPEKLPRDLSFREAAGLLHLAELFDLESLRVAARWTIRHLFRSRVLPAEFEWAFGRGSRLVGALMYQPNVPVKIALVEHLTHLWNKDVPPADEKAYFGLGKANLEFYLLVKSYCLGNVNEEGVNDM
jgi:hypothetical protein